MMRATDGDFETGWQDLLACHRLARLLQRGGTLMEMLIGIACEQMAAKSEAAYLDHSRLSSQQIMASWRELESLQAMPLVADKMELTERLVFLQMIQGFARYGPEYIDFSAGIIPKDKNFWSRLFTHSSNFDVAFRNANYWFDRHVASLRVANRYDRARELTIMKNELWSLKYHASNKSSIEKELLGPKERGEMIGNIMIGLLLPNFHKVQAAAERTEQAFRNLHLAFALAAYHADHRRYPQMLAELEPKYIDKIPDDLFSGQPLIYKLENDGYLLYSVGGNGIDDGGQSYDDDPKGDDLVIRMPVPEPKLK